MQWFGGATIMEQMIVHSRTTWLLEITLFFCIKIRSIKMIIQTLLKLSRRKHRKFKSEYNFNKQYGPSITITISFIWSILYGPSLWTNFNGHIQNAGNLVRLTLWWLRFSDFRVHPKTSILNILIDWYILYRTLVYNISYIDCTVNWPILYNFFSGIWRLN